ncbi:MAG: hypothetical protein AAFV53_42425 [Myxococcota bacterium]
MQSFHVGELEIHKDAGTLTVSFHPRRTIISTLLMRARPDPQQLIITPRTITVNDRPSLRMADIQDVYAATDHRSAFDVQAAMCDGSTQTLIQHLHQEEVDWLLAEVKFTSARSRAAQALLKQMR